TNINGIQLDSPKLADVLVDYNVYYSSGGGQIFGDLAGGDQSPDDLSTWQTALTGDAGVSVAEPNGVVLTEDPFADEANGDYTLVDGSGAVGAGNRWWTGAPPEGLGEP
ncbi:unnamed protein product, partial [marine sediment metagenome]